MLLNGMLACGASCETDIKTYAEAVADTGVDMAVVLEACWKQRGTACSDAVSQFVDELGEAGENLGSAAQDCAGASAQCRSDIESLGHKVKSEAKLAARIASNCGNFRALACANDLANFALDAPSFAAGAAKILASCRPHRPPGPKPQPTGQKWPVFSSLAALQADPWAKYFKGVYGELPTSFPLRTEDLWMLYNAELIKYKVKDVPKSVGMCPEANPPLGQRYDINNMYSPHFLSWIWHPYPYQETASKSFVEVTHEADPFGDEHFGAWFVYSPGSGIYFDVGKTIAFPEHKDAYKHFGVTGAAHPNEALSRAAAGKGYDSVQFLAHVDHVNYQCDTHNTGKAGLQYMGKEILATKLVGTHSCTSPSGAPSVIRAGWKASRACSCHPSKQFLNCDGVPSLEATRSNETLMVLI